MVEEIEKHGKLPYGLEVFHIEPFFAAFPRSTTILLTKGRTEII
jgi:hypothetical protein